MFLKSATLAIYETRPESYTLMNRSGAAGSSPPAASLPEPAVPRGLPAHTPLWLPVLPARHRPSPRPVVPSVLPACPTCCQVAAAARRHRLPRPAAATRPPHITTGPDSHPREPAAPTPGAARSPRPSPWPARPPRPRKLQGRQRPPPPARCSGRRRPRPPGGTTPPPTPVRPRP